jgi:lipopolysaccharide/colanic/teichoic acid biosynthesis glycosyltransferase
MTLQNGIFDILLGLALSLAMIPAMIIITIVLLVKQGRPLFYIAERMQAPTKSFGLIKFRTMIVVEGNSGVSGADKDARLTPIGAKLRSKRLDEMPQALEQKRAAISALLAPRPSAAMWSGSPSYTARS